MKITSLASSSAGNAYMISDGQTTLLIDCGISIKELKKRSDFIIPSLVDACLITHEHNDHTKSLKDLLRMGMRCYMLSETAASKGIESSYFTNFIKYDMVFTVKTFTIKVLQMHHDVPCCGFLIHSNKTKENVLFAIDTYYIPYSMKNLNYIMIEANHDLTLLDGDERKDRLYKSHMSIQTVLQYLRAIDLSAVEKIYLMHLSDTRSDEEKFKEVVQRVTGKIVEVFGK